MDEVIMEFETPSADVRVEQGWVLHRVPQYMRENKKHIYDPVVLSLGPYHHGRTQQFHLAEKVKDKAVDIVCDGVDKGFLLSKIRERVDEIKHYFGAEECSRYNEAGLAEMMLRDACFVLCCIDTRNFDFDFEKIVVDGLGFSGFLLLMLENQIPLWFIELVFSLTHGGDDDDGDKFRKLLFNYFASGGFSFREWVEEPLHLLEAKILVSFIREAGEEERVRKPKVVSISAAAGIHFGPSSCCLQDITFVSPKLQLPEFMVTNDTQAFLSFEVSQGRPLDFSITSYVAFMKMLVGDAKDARELREKGILFNCLGSDEEVVRVFQGVDTYGFPNGDGFLEVKMRIMEHCNSKAKTWMAELRSTYFRSPWTAIALFAAIAILTLTFLQTYYTINQSP